MSDTARSPATEWYEQLREQYRPAPLRYLLVGESVPDPGASERRFFYSPNLSRYDNLYRGIASALYGDRLDLRAKTTVLEQIRGDGFWLIDVVDHPTNKLNSAARARNIREGIRRLVERCVQLAPERGVIVCHGKVYAAAAQALRNANVRLLHDEPLPFPLGNWRARFIEGFRRALPR